MKPIKYISLITALVIFCGGCSNGAAVGENQSDRQAEPDTAVGKYEYAIGQFSSLPQLAYTIDASYVVEVETPDGPGTVITDQSYQYAMHIDSGVVAECSYIWTETTTTNTPYQNDTVTSTGHSYQNEDTVYFIKDGQTGRQPHTPEAVGGDLPFGPDELPFPIGEALQQGAEVTGNTISAGPLSFDYSFTAFAIDSIFIELLDDGKIDTIRADGIYQATVGEAPVVRFSFTWRAASYTEAEIQRLEGIEDFPVADSASGQSGISHQDEGIVLGTLSGWREEFEAYEGYFVGYGVHGWSSYPTGREFSDFPTTLLLFREDADQRILRGGDPLTPANNPEFFFITAACPITSVDIVKVGTTYDGTVTIDGRTATLGSSTLILFWDDGWWMQMDDDLDSLTGMGDFYCIYGVPGSDEVELIIQQHDTYMP